MGKDIRGHVFKRYLTYFRRAHQQFFIFIISWWNFLVINHIAFQSVIDTWIPNIDVSDFINYVSGATEQQAQSYIIPSFITFSILFTIFYSTITVMLGFWDIRRGTFPTDTSIGILNTPFWQDFVKSRIAELEGDKGTAKKVMEKWVKEKN